MNARGMARPLIGKILHRPLRLRAPEGLLGNLQLTHAVAFYAVTVLCHRMLLSRICRPVRGSGAWPRRPLVYDSGRKV